jgi:hypothetical protein
MSKNTTQEIKAVPFFARFLEEQAEPPATQPEETPPETEEPGPIWTIKWPSDWEEI